MRYTNILVPFIKDKEITIIHRETHLLGPIYPDKFRTGVDKKWSDRGIQLILGDEIVSFPQGPSTSITTTKGEEVAAEVVVRLLKHSRSKSDTFCRLPPVAVDRTQTSLRSHWEMAYLRQMEASTSSQPSSFPITQISLLSGTLSTGPNRSSC